MQRREERHEQRADPDLGHRDRLKAITEEMGLVMLRTARSPILSEARDFSLGLYDANGKMLEQTEYIPILAFAVEPRCAHRQYFGDNLHEGDVIIHNDPYTGGNQPADVKIVRPVFSRTSFGWLVITAHQADVGGAVAARTTRERPKSGRSPCASPRSSSTRA